MITELLIKNFILIDQVEIAFHKGLNVITGETGAGKSVILSALSFLLGEKLESSIIRNPDSPAVVQALFEIGKLSLLEEAGIEHIEGEELIIRRELSHSGKSRAFINNQSISLSLLKKLAPHLLEFSGQHAHLKLLEESAPLNVLDDYINLSDQKKSFKSAWEDELSIKNEISRIESSTSERIRLIDNAKRELEEIVAAKILPDEDEGLFSEFQILSNQAEMKGHCSEILFCLDESKTAVIQQLIRQKASFEKLFETDPTLKETSESFLSAIAELQEVVYEMRRYQTKLEAHPTRLQVVEERLKEISSIKRKYGASFTEIEAYKGSLEAKLLHLENEDARLEELKERVGNCEKVTNTLADALTTTRKISGEKLAKEITREIQALNMPKALFEIAISKKTRSVDGDDKVTFFLTPNVGEKRINVQEAASGGELARVSLALQVTMIESYKTPTILFDEIDANIGGTTATIIGEKLAFLGKSVQVLSITHFPQVANQACAHFVICKSEQNGRTQSTVLKLTTQKEKHKELTRMLGGTKLLAMQTTAKT